MKKKDLAEVANISTYTINKLNRGENVNTDTLVRICHALNCGLEDIMELVDEPFPKKWTRKMRKKQNEANRSE